MWARASLCCLSLLFVGCAEEPVPSTPEVPEEPYVEPMVIDLGSNADDSWYAVNDTVMGGVSQGVVEYTNNSMVFEGEVSTANNGGFTSVRSVSGSTDLRDFDRVVIRLKSEGQPFTMVLADSPYWWEGQFRHDIEVSGSGWNDIEIDLGNFEFFEFMTGYPEPTGEMMQRKDKKEILHMEFMSELFKDGPFRLEVDSISFE